MLTSVLQPGLPGVPGTGHPTAQGMRTDPPRPSLHICTAATIPTARPSLLGPETQVTQTGLVPTGPTQPVIEHAALEDRTAQLPGSRAEVEPLALLAMEGVQMVTDKTCTQAAQQRSDRMDPRRQGTCRLRSAPGSLKQRGTDHVLIAQRPSTVAQQMEVPAALQSTGSGAPAAVAQETASGSGAAALCCEASMWIWHTGRQLMLCCCALPPTALHAYQAPASNPPEAYCSAPTQPYCHELAPIALCCSPSSGIRWCCTHRRCPKAEGHVQEPGCHLHLP